MSLPWPFHYVSYRPSFYPIFTTSPLPLWPLGGLLAFFCISNIVICFNFIGKSIKSENLTCTLMYFKYWVKDLAWPSFAFGTHSASNDVFLAAPIILNRNFDFWSTLRPQFPRNVFLAVDYSMMLRNSFVTSQSSLDSCTPFFCR